MSVTTAADYLQTQLDLEREARELMPYDPNNCTYTLGELRQPVFACLTCSRQNKNEPIGVCYSCSIQCHASHDIVELFAKRSFVCDCGTTKMKNTQGGSCNLRQSGEHGQGNLGSRRGSSTHRPISIKLDAEDIPSLSNQYNQNYKGLFCSCLKPYNPLEETGSMIQCYFGFECGEDWYHEECILGYVRGTIANERETIPKEKDLKLGNQLHKLEDIEEGEEAVSKKRPIEDSDEEDEESEVPYFPRLDDFDLFICWKCVDKFKEVFELLSHEGFILCTLPHFKGINSTEEWKEMYTNLESKRIKREDSSKHSEYHPYSIFLKPEFKDHLKNLASSEPPTKLTTFLQNNPYLFNSDPVYQPPDDDDDDGSSSTGSLLYLGTEALLSLPREQAIQGLQAYDKIKEKLRDFFKPFAEDGKIVTEDEVRSFFNKVKEEQ